MGARPGMEAEFRALCDQFADEDLDGHENVFFRAKLLGGKLTKRSRGKTSDAAGGYVRDQHAYVWCLIYRYPKQRSFLDK